MRENEENKTIELPGKELMNFVELALTPATSKFTGDLIERRDTILDPATRKPVERRLLIQAPEQIGLPNPTDELILLHLIARTYQQHQFRDRRLDYSRYQLCKDLGWTLTGPNFERIKLATLRWKGTIYVYDKAWWHPQKGWLTRSFSVIDNTNDWEKGSESWILWNQNVVESFQDGYIKNLDLEYIRALKSSVSWKLYRILDKHFNRPKNAVLRKLTYDLHSLACTKIGIPEGYPIKELKRILYGSVTELAKTGYLKPQTKEETFSKVASGSWKICLQRRFSRSRTTQVKQESEFTGLTKELVDRGVGSNQAIELVSAYSPEVIQEKIEAFDWLKSRQDKGLSKNPPGYLIESIRANYSLPIGFETKAQKQQRLEHARKCAEAREEKEQRRRQQEDEEFARQRAPIAAYIDSLSPTQRQDMEMQALAVAELFDREHAEKDTQLGRAIRQKLVDDYVKKILSSQTVLN